MTEEEFAELPGPTFYAIVDFNTNTWLPNVGKGATRAELTNKQPPRLFNKRHHAASAREHWLKGKAQANRDYETGEHLGNVIKPVPKRALVASTLGVVELKLTGRFLKEE